MTRFALAALAVTVLLLLALPPFVGLSIQNALTKMLIASLFAAAFNLLAGQAGLLSFGHAAYFGIGAIATLQLMRAIEDGSAALPTPLLPLAGLAAGLVVGAIAGYFATKRAGVYFSLVTLAIAELLHSLAPHWEGVFGGEAGLSSMRMPWAGISFGSALEVYYVTLGWVVVCLLLLWAYTRTPFGRLTLALRENEQRVRFLGYDTHTTKVVVFAISAALSGAAGGLLAVANETANYSLFSIHMSAQVVLHTFVGGAGFFFGPVIGASLLTLFSVFVSEATRSWLLYQGILFVLVMLFAPRGIGGVIDIHLRHWRRLEWGSLVPAYALSLVSACCIGMAVIFVVEATGILLSDHYAALRRSSGSAPPLTLFGQSWDPTSLMTWAVPLMLVVIGAVLLPPARRQVRAAWDRILERAAVETQPLHPTSLQPAR
ncbi:branched-chain amino acid ABC transporter permease [Microvirga massiliensis]|uniref:branched-chain amino acid ABC transporter permease n=1 Tax=Microvirga massiliensis TaxID=1033741 RepID=UPI00062BA744|nr:branched-chain amino acid ABC transporter permease [Microvirga massiliensis]